MAKRLAWFARIYPLTAREVTSLKYPVIKRFRDKYTRIIHDKGTFYITDDEERGEYLRRAGFLGKGLVEETKKSEETIMETPARETAATYTVDPSILDQSIAKLKADLANIEDITELERLRVMEVGGNTRKGALRAIDERISEIKGE